MSDEDPAALPGTLGFDGQVSPACSCALGGEPVVWFAWLRGGAPTDCSESDWKKSESSSSGLSCVGGAPCHARLGGGVFFWDCPSVSVEQRPCGIVWFSVP